MQQTPGTHGSETPAYVAHCRLSLFNSLVCGAGGVSQLIVYSTVYITVSSIPNVHPLHIRSSTCVSSLVTGVSNPGVRFLRTGHWSLVTVLRQSARVLMCMHMCMCVYLYRRMCMWVWMCMRMWAADTFRKPLNVH